MANVGTVQSVTGIVKAIAEDGTERILSIGDTVAENEKIVTGDGVIVIAFTDGTVLDLGSNSSVVLNDDVLNPDGEQTAQSRSEAENEVAALQEALANDPNFDPSALPATAAGPAAGGTDDNNGHTVVSVDYLNPRAPVEAGFDTIGISQEFLQADEELPPVIEEPESLPTLSIDDVTVIEPSGFSSGEDGGSQEGPRGGGIFVTGHDSDEHENGEYMSAGLDFLLFGQASDNAGRAGKTIAIIGDGSDGFVSVLEAQGWTVIYYQDGDANILDAFNADAILVESGNDASLQAQLLALKDNFTDYINNGGSLYINTDEGGGQAWYDFVPNFGTALNNSISAQGAFGVTADGLVIGLTEAIVDADITHSYFEGVDVNLFTVFETFDDNGLPVAFGSRNIIIGDGGFEATVDVVIAEFTVTLSEVSSVDVIVKFVTADGTAISGGSGVAENDYGSTSGTLTIPAGSLSATIEVTVFGDGVTEFTEQYLVILSEPVNATIADGEGVGTILDGDKVEFSITALFGADGDQFSFVEEGQLATYTISYTGVLADGVQASVTFDTASGTTVNFDAIEGVDFDESTGTLTFTGGGPTSVVVSVQTTDDAIAENDEHYTCLLYTSPSPRDRG